jgi:hypothetical protein
VDTVQFVDKVSSSPTVRLDLNDDTTWSLRYEGTDFSPPRRRRAEVSSMLAHGARIPAAVYENRMLRLSLDLQTASVDAAATEIQKLARELNRVPATPTAAANFLKWQPGTTNPVFFRILPSDLNRITEVPGTGTLRHLDVELLAEEFAYGLPETLSTVTVNRDPAAGSNPTYFDVSGVKGDVPAATKINVGDAFFNIPGTLAIRRRGTPSNAPYLVQAEAMTMGTDTTVQSNDTAMSGSGSNYTRTTFATATMATRISTFVPASASVDARGIYRVFVRYRRSSGIGVINLRLAVGPEGSGSLSTTLSTVGTETTTSIRYADLGLIQIPFGIDAVYDGPSGSELQVSASAVQIAVQAERLVGSSTLDLDLVLLVPADDQLAVIDVGNDSVNSVIFDSYLDMAYADDTTGKADSSADIVVLGPMLELAPGVTNRVYMRVGHLISGSNPVDITYWPRYLYVRPAST